MVTETGSFEFLAGIVLTLFISFFLIKDGHRIWRFRDQRYPAGSAPAGRGRPATRPRRALVNYIRGTTVVAAIHALFIGLALWLLGVPLLVPLIVLIFLAAYVPSSESWWSARWRSWWRSRPRAGSPRSSCSASSSWRTLRGLLLMC